MQFYELLLIGIGLAMDAFAVSITNGLVYKNMTKKLMLMTCLCFGVFQGVMPTIGYFVGRGFSSYISAYDHYIALILLGFIGGKMLIDAIKERKEEIKQIDKSLTVPILLVQGVATSIDALAVGVSFAILPNVSITFSAGIIAIITFVMCLVAFVIGKRFGKLLNDKAQIFGGLILISIGLKIFIEHQFFGG